MHLTIALAIIIISMLAVSAYFYEARISLQSGLPFAGSDQSVLNSIDAKLSLLIPVGIHLESR